MSQMISITDIIFFLIYCIYLAKHIHIRIGKTRNVMGVTS